MASSMMSAGSSNVRFTTGSDLVLCLGPEHAAIIARDGLTKDDVKDYLFNTARISLDLFSEEHLAHRKKAPAQYGDFVEGKPIPIVLNKENILVIVAGGAGLHSCWMPSWGGPKHRAVTKLIRTAN